MRSLLVFLILALTGCVEDAAPSASDDSNGGMDAGAPGTSDGSLEDIDACLSDDWFCVEGAPDAGPTVATDGAKPPGEGNKPPMGDFREGLIQKKQTGWYGVVNDEQTVYGYLAFAGGVQTCDVVYPWMDLQMVDGCAQCAFAQSGTLGEPEVAIDTACGESVDMAEATVAYGHGLQATPFPGFFDLYVAKGGEWLKGGFSTYAPDAGWYFFAEEGGDDMPTPVDDAKSAGWDVELNRETGQGEYAYQAKSEAGDLVCDLFFPIVDAVANDGCDACAFAYDLPLGPREVRLDGPACANAYDLSGITLTAGHVAPDTLLFLKQGNWDPVPGATSEVEDDRWHFYWEDD